MTAKDMRGMEAALRESPFEWDLYGIAADLADESGQNRLALSYREIFEKKGEGLTVRAMARFLGYSDFGKVVSHSSWLGVPPAGNPPLSWVVYRWEGFTQPGRQILLTNLHRCGWNANNRWENVYALFEWQTTEASFIRPWDRERWRIDAGPTLFGSREEVLLRFCRQECPGGSYYYAVDSSKRVCTLALVGVDGQTVRRGYSMGSMSVNSLT